MSLAKRRLLFYFFILLFAAIVPLILLYATGNSVNWQRLELEKTAGIIADSDPAGATVTLNGQVPGSLARQFFGQAPDPHTKTKLSGLRPGQYVLRLELAGYAPWEEKIDLEPGQVHNIGTVRLFQKNAALLVAPLASPAAYPILSPDGKHLAVLSGSRLSIIALADGSTQAADLTPAAAGSEPSWSPDGRFLLVGRQLYDRQTAALSDAAASAGITPSLLRWSTDGKLWALEGTRLWRLDPLVAGKQSVLDLADRIGAVKVSDLRIENNRIMLLLASPLPQLLIIDSAAPEREARQDLPAGQYRFATDGQGNALVQQTGGGALYRLDHPLPLLSSYRLSLIAERFMAGRWNDAELFYATPFELRHWSGNGSGELLSRWGEAVTAIARIPQSDYYLFAAGNVLYIRPATAQPFADSLPLLRTERFDSLVRIGEHELYFSGRVGSQEGLFRIAF